MIVVTGPNVEAKRSPALGPALSAAIYYATRPDAGEGTWYVREQGAAVYHVERDERGVVTTKEMPA